MDVKRAVVAGIAGTVVMTVLLLWAPLVGLPKLAIGDLLSSALAASVTILRVGPAGGWVTHGLVGIALALLYGGAFATRLPGTPVARGLLYGALVFLVAQLVFMPAVGAGVFSRGDAGLLLGSLLGHLAYGAVVGGIYGAPRRSLAAGLAAAILVASGRPALAHAQSAGAPPAAGAPALDPKVVDAGRAIFHGEGTCHACHGDDLGGGPMAPSLRGPRWRNIDGSYDAILRRIQQGKEGTLMIAHPGDITDAQVVQVATYVWAVSQGRAKP